MKVQGTALRWSRYLRPCITVKRRVWSMPGARLAHFHPHTLAHFKLLILQPYAKIATNSQLSSLPPF